MENEILEKINLIENMLNEQQFKQKAILSFQEATKFLNVSSSYLYKLTSQHEIPHFKPRGKMLYFDRQEIESWLMQNKVKTKQEIEQAANDYCLCGKRG